MDPYKHQRISLNSDGSLNRPSDPPVPPSTDEQSPVLALSRDIPLNSTNTTSLRLYIPKPSPNISSLPVIIYIHAGGFVLLHNSSFPVHNSCALRAAKIPAIVVSVDYRLAPEHRLPAAYDDAVEALLWVRDQARSDPAVSDPWLRDYADFSKCFIMGTSAGANAAYNLGLRCLNLDVEPLKINGLILSQPFFGGVERTESEEAAVDYDSCRLPMPVLDLMWELSLPVGADREHECCNPVKTIGKAKGLPRCLVKGFVGDPLLDRMKIFAGALEKEAGVSIVKLMEDEGFHCMEFFDAEKAEAMAAEFGSFIYADGKI